MNKNEVNPPHLNNPSGQVLITEGGQDISFLHIPTNEERQLESSQNESHSGSQVSSDYTGTTIGKLCKFCNRVSKNWLLILTLLIIIVIYYFYLQVLYKNINSFSGILLLF
jgi:hypothetical protein